MAIREGKWKCPGCETVNRGRDVNCTACGKARENVEFFLEDDDAPEVTDAKELAAATAGADWLCAFCDQSNKAGGDKCSSCGAPRAEGKERASGDVVGLGYKSASEQKKAEAAAAAAPAETPAPAKPAGPMGKLVGGCMVLGLLLCCIFAIVLGRKREAALTVGQVSWKRTIQVQRYDTVQKTDWSVPSGGRVLSSKQEVKSYRDVQTGTKSVDKTRQVQSGTKKVKVGKKDKGNGFFEDVYKDEPVYKTEHYTEQEPVYRKEPIYATKYTYEVEEWIPDHDETAAGNDVAPRWPEVKLVIAGGKKAREGTRHEEYSVSLVEDEGKKETFVYKPKSESDFVRFAAGSRWVADVGHGEAVNPRPPGSK